MAPPVHVVTSGTHGFWTHEDAGGGPGSATARGGRGGLQPVLVAAVAAPAAAEPTNRIKHAHRPRAGMRANKARRSHQCMRYRQTARTLTALVVVRAVATGDLAAAAVGLRGAPHGGGCAGFGGATRTRPAVQAHNPTRALHAVQGRGLAQLRQAKLQPAAARTQRGRSRRRTRLRACAETPRA